MNQSHSAHFIVHLSKEIGGAERLLSTVRRRGFKVDSLLATRNGSDDGYRFEMRLNGERCFKTLARHIANHLDVVSVSLLISDLTVEYPAPKSPKGDAMLPTESRSS